MAKTTAERSREYRERKRRAQIDAASKAAIESRGIPTTAVAAMLSGRPGGGPAAAMRLQELPAGPAQVHGLTDGSWSLSDGLAALLSYVGASDVVVATWTAGAADLKRAEGMLRSQRIRSFRLLVDRSFLTRQPKYCEMARSMFGDDAIRVWSSHAKFCLVRGARDCLLITSMNLNANKRLESYSLFCDVEPLIPDYRRLVEDLFDLQLPGAGFRESTSCRRDMERVLQRAATEATAATAAAVTAPAGDGIDAVRRLFDEAAVDPASAGMTLEGLARTALALERAELEIRKRRRDADELVEASAVRRCWSDAMTAASKTLLGLPETLAAELAGVSDEGAVRRILAGQVEAALAELDRSPSTWPVAVGPWR